MSRVPRIRFKGFEEDWEQRKVNEIIEDYIEKTTIQNQYTVLTSSQQKGIVYQEEYFSDRQVTTNANIGYYVLPRGYFTYRSRSDTNVFVFNRNDIIDKGIISYYYPVFFNKNSDSNFLLRRLNTGIERQIIMAAEGTGQHVLAHSKFKNMDIFVPYLDEQKRIGKYFESLDHLITLHQRKLEKLIIIKKSMLENLFPQNGEKTPKIRFSGFTKDWEQRKLGEYLIQYTEVTIINDQYPVLTSSRKGIFFQKDYYDGNQIASENNTGYNIVPYGYFTYRHMSDDEIFYFNINDIIDNGIVSTLYPVFTTNNRLDSKFLQYELNFGKEFRKYSALQKQGGSRTYMYFNKLRDLQLTITTSLKEQECIRNLICSIDHLITLHQLEPFQLIFKAIAYRIIDYTKSKPPRCR